MSVVDLWIERTRASVRVPCCNSHTWMVANAWASAARREAWHRSSLVRPVQEAEDCVAEPMGLYLVNERSGKLSEPVHPFGPGGEGGRDDAIYSSPANLQAS